MEFGSIKKLEKFSTILEEGIGVILVTDTASTENIIHTVGCSDVNESDFNQRVIVDHGSTGEYFFFNNTTHVLKNRSDVKFCTKCVPQFAEKTNALNNSGTFLQIAVIDILKRSIWDVQPEFPISLAPFIKDPMKYPGIGASGVGTTRSSLFSQAVNDSQNQFLRKETSIDVVASQVHGENHYVLCCEIKKLNPNYVDWCFFKEMVEGNEIRLVTKSLTRNGLVNLLHVNPTETGKPAIDIQIEKFDKLTSFQPLCCDYGVGLHKDEAGVYKHQNNSLSEAARQCIEGTYGMIASALVNQVSSGVGYDYNCQFFIPILVTNANLYFCTYDVQDIDIEKGEIPKIKYEKRNNILYECPLPMMVHFPNTITSVTNSIQQKATIRWQVFIVNPAGLNELLKKIQDDIFSTPAS